MAQPSDERKGEFLDDGRDSGEVPSPPAPPSPEETYEAATGRDREALREIARYQRYVLLCLLARIVVGVTVYVLAGKRHNIWWMVDAGLGVLMLLYVYRMATALGKRTVVSAVYVVLVLVPVVSLLALAALNQQATHRLKSEGVRVGFLGTNPKRI